jgi:hypothetical protein
MKKLLIVPIMALGMLFATNANAQVNGQDRDADKKVTEKVEMQDKYSKIEVTALPASVKAAAERDFEGSTVSEAYVAKDGTYKLLLINENGEKGWVYADKTGKWIQPKS